MKPTDCIKTETKRRLKVRRNERALCRCRERLRHPITMIFSSFGFQSPIVCEKVSSVLPTGDALETKTCLILPFAGFDAARTGGREKQGLVAFGFSPERIFTATEDDPWPCLTPDVIYVTGGDPFKLLKAVRDHGLIPRIREAVLERRAIYIGVSAGAYIAAESVRYVTRLEDNNELSDGFGALGLVPDNILCHYDHYGYPMLKECEEIGEKPIRTLNDDEVLMYRNRRWQYIGKP